MILMSVEPLGGPSGSLRVLEETAEVPWAALGIPLCGPWGSLCGGLGSFRGLLWSLGRLGVPGAVGSPPKRRKSEFV